MHESLFLNPEKVLQLVGLQGGMHVADFGAGSGVFTLAAAREVGDSGVVWAVDVNSDMLTRIKNHAIIAGMYNVEVVRGDVAMLNGSNLPSNTFDFVIISNILFMLEHKSALIDEVRRVLKDGGRALVIDWSDSFKGLGPHTGHVVTEKMARALFMDGELPPVKDIPAGKYHWGFIVGKNL